VVQVGFNGHHTAADPQLCYTADHVTRIHSSPAMRCNRRQCQPHLEVVVQVGLNGRYAAADALLCYTDHVTRQQLFTNNALQ
jgi:hypothetical protein